MRRFLLLLFLFGCGRTAPLSPGIPLMDSVGVKGLYTYPNPLGSQMPPGALVVANNAVIDRPGEVSPRRGLPRLSPTFPSGGTANAGVFFQGKLLVHTTSNKLAWIDPTTPSAWTELSGTYSAPPGARMQFAAANKNLYFTTASGVYRLDAYSGTPVAAGGIKALAPQASQTGTTGFQSANTEVGYRALWATRDANGNLILGFPSPRIVQLGTSSPVACASGSLTRAASTVTAAITAHGFVVGDVVYLSSTDSNFPSGNKTVATVADANHFTYTESGAATSSAVATSFYYASRNNSVTVPIPSGVTTSYFAQVYRTAQSVDATVDPGDEEALVYEYYPSNVDIAAGSFTFTDLAPDSLRGAALYTNPSQGGILANGAEQPPICTSLAFFRGSLLAGCTTQKYRLTLSLLAIGGANGMALNDTIGFVASDGTLAQVSADTSEDPVFSTFKLYTTGTPAQNIANTVQSLVRALNATTAAASGYLQAYYSSGPDDPPGMFLLELPPSQTAPGYVFQKNAGVTSTRYSYWSPQIPASVTVQNLSRTSSTVTATCSRNHGLVVGQTFDLERGTPVADFPNGTKTVASVIDGTHFTYTEAGAATSSSAGWGTTNRGSLKQINGGNFFPSNLPLLQQKQPNAIAISPTNEPDSFPLENLLFAGSPSATIRQLVAVRDRVFIFTDTDGVFQLTGSSPDNFVVTPFDPTIDIVGPVTAVPLNNQVYALTKQGVVAISDGGTAVVSESIGGDLLDLIAASVTQVDAVSFAVAYESDHKYILFTTTASDTTKAAQAYVYNYETESWTQWSIAGAFGVVDPSADKLWIGDATASTARVESKTRTYADNYDGTVAVTISSHSGTTVNVASATGVNVGDRLVQGGLASTVRAVNGNALTVADSLAWSNAAATVYTAYQFRVKWPPLPFGKPDNMKQVYEADLLLGDGRFDTATLDFDTDLSGTGTESVTVGGTSAIGGIASNTQLRSAVPQEKATFNTIDFQFTCQNALASPRIRGFTLEGFAFSE